MNIVELTAHAQEQKSRGRPVSIPADDLLELIRGYQAINYGMAFAPSHDTPDISGLIRLWPFPQSEKP